MTIEETFADYDARIKAAGVPTQPIDYFRAGYVFGGCKQLEKADIARKQASQFAIALGKYATGYRPGDEGWAPRDQEALESVMTGKPL